MARARLKQPQSLTPDARLNTPSVDVWLSPDERERLRVLMDDGSFDARKEAWLMCTAAWDWRGSFDDLLTCWAEDRRSVACVTWRRQHPDARVEFTPPVIDWLTGI